MRAFVLLALLIAGGIFGMGGCRATGKAAGPRSSPLRTLPDKPNVIVVLVDDQGFGDLSAHGNPVLKTPHLDQLRAESVRLTDFHMSPMCTPSRGQLLTGRDALLNGAMNVAHGRMMIRSDIPTMANVFSQNGYRTGIFGKWHLGDGFPHRPSDRGFQETLWFRGSHLGAAGDHWNNDYFDDTLIHNGKPRVLPGYITDALFDEAIRWMKERSQNGERFFTYLPLNAPHSPFFAPDSYKAPYAHLPPKVAGYFGMVANIDDNMAKLDRALKEIGQWENTVVIYTSDNGGSSAVSDKMFNAGMRGRKKDLYEGGHRVPFFVRWPGGGLVDRDVDALTQVQDVLPTLIDLCGLKAASDLRFDGTSLAKALRGQGEIPTDRMLVVQYSRLHDPVPQKGDAAVMWMSWRLVADKELYELGSDPGQTTNVADRYTDVMAKMRAHYEGWWSKAEPLIDASGAIVIGSSDEEETTLSGSLWSEVFLDQSGAILKGEKKNGTVSLTVAREGNYRFSLRRWPIEADAALTAPLPAFKATQEEFPAGVALPITRARLKVGKFDGLRDVAPSDKEVVFTARLSKGPVKLQTWFFDREGQPLSGAYFVYVRHVSEL